MIVPRSCNFISLMINGFTNSANKEELIFIAFCNRNVKTQEVRSQTRYLAIINPDSCNAEGLVNCLQGALIEKLGIDIYQKDSVLVNQLILVVEWMEHQLM